MAENKNDAKEAALRGISRFKQWKEEHDKNWNTDNSQFIGDFMSNLSPEVIANLERLSPEAMGRLKQKYGGK